ncbi:general transcription factor 3C polypeptide 5 [Parasteatoda tepidariorum]|uniref:general transcription factor 3C polypeptide 5 n=1 Tax=Parasteatoda tepidariorum TaxID=114398 RepID=UPI00077FB66A|nr:general transcription factor 3C polypeptide 5 [Parasteatoda tepidariorum]
MDVKFNSKQLITIDYPGTVVNLDNMIKTLGGEAEMWSTFSNRTKRLELKFRPDDPHCKCVHGDMIKTTTLMMKVIKRTKKSSKKEVKKKEPTYSMELLGVSCSSYKFQSLVDFQILPIAFDEQLNEYKSLIPNIIPTELHPVSWLDQEMELFIPPLMYSRFDVPQNGYIETNKAKASLANRSLPENIIGKCRKRRAGFAVFVTFDSKETPSEPQALALKQLETYPLDLELKVKIDEFFKEKPIWSRNAIAYKLKCDRSRLKYPLPCSAYYFTNGPWRTLWVKFGYDPRTTPASKPFQVLDLRIHANIPINEHKIQPRTKNFGLSNKAASIQKNIPITTDLLVVAKDEDENMSDQDLKTRRLLTEYIPGELPTARQCFYQLCDIHLESVQALIHQNDGREDICHERDGWCELGTLEKCRELILADIMKTNKLGN